jgi:hypothetical protein
MKLWYILVTIAAGAIAWMTYDYTPNVLRYHWTIESVPQHTRRRFTMN